VKDSTALALRPLRLGSYDYKGVAKWPRGAGKSSDAWEPCDRSGAKVSLDQITEGCFKVDLQKEARSAFLQEVLNGKRNPQWRKGNVRRIRCGTSGGSFYDSLWAHVERKELADKCGSVERSLLEVTVWLGSAGSDRSFFEGIFSEDKVEAELGLIRGEEVLAVSRSVRDAALRIAGGGSGGSRSRHRKTKVSIKDHLIKTDMILLTDLDRSTDTTTEALGRGYN